MKKKYKVCRILAAAGNEAGVSAILNVLRGAVPREEISVSQAFSHRIPARSRWIS